MKGRITGREMAPPARFERTTFPLGGERSIQLSYGGMGLGVKLCSQWAVYGVKTPICSLHLMPDVQEFQAFCSLHDWQALYLPKSMPAMSKCASAPSGAQPLVRRLPGAADLISRLKAHAAEARQLTGG